MANYRYKTLSVLALILLLTPVAHAQITPDDIGTDKLAQTSFKFLEISTDARAAALGDALTAFDVQSSVAMFYNPAGMARLENSFSATFGMTQWIADINYNSASAAFSPMDGRYGVFGVALMFSDYGDDFIGTIGASNEQGYLEYERDLGLSNPSPSALMVGLGYAMAVTDRFSVGANAKYVSQDLGEAVLTSGGSATGNDASTVAFDFGVLYKTGFRSLNFAMSVRNFAQELQYVNENFELPLTFNVGLSMDLIDLTTMNPNQHAFRLAVDAKRPRDFTEQIKLGGEYTFMDVLSLRAGYTFPADEQSVSLGAGLKYGTAGMGIGVDYAYTSFGVFSEVHRFGVHLSF